MTPSLKDTLFAKAVRYSVLRVHPQKKETVGVDDGEVPPVPIPNTEVKLTRAEDSWLETACENRYMPTSLLIWPVGQAVKTAASHAVNVGSIPARVTIKALLLRRQSFLLCVAFPTELREIDG